MPTVRPARLAVEALEARDVPAVLDLTTAGASGAINGATFVQTDPQPTGTGVIESFVRVQALGNKTTEQGYNTSARPLQYDENSSPVFTRGVTVGDLPLVTIGGVPYRELLLDINQKASASKLSLDELRVYVGTGGSLTGYDPATKTLAGLTPVYDLDAGGDNWVKLDARLNHGSGSGDMFFYVPDAVLGGSGNNFYLYSKFGTNIATNGGFEEWARGLGGDSVSPEASSLSGTISLGSNFPGDLTGAVVRLTFADGSTDEAEVVDNGDGTYSYSFKNILLDGDRPASIQLFAGSTAFIAPTEDEQGQETLDLTLSVGVNTFNFVVLGYAE